MLISFCSSSQVKGFQVSPKHTGDGEQLRSWTHMLPQNSGLFLIVTLNDVKPHLDSGLTSNQEN